MKKLISIISAASVITFSLFVFMAYLVHNSDVNIVKPLPTVIVDVYQTEKETSPVEISRALPEPPKPPEAIPQVLTVADEADVDTGIPYTQVNVNIPNTATELTGTGFGRDQEARPIVRISPKYPMIASRDGIEGWVKLAFDINKLGEVVNITIIESNPKRVFDKAAKQALKRWKYKDIYLKLPSSIKGWLSAKSLRLTSPEETMTQYILTGEKRYLSLLVEEFNGSLFHYLLSQSDPATAQDVVQSTWLKVIKSQSTVAPSNIKSWLFTIARNTLIDELRKQNKWQIIHEDKQELVCSNLNAEQQLVHQHNIDKFNYALLQLPLLQREAFIFQQEGFSIVEICELTQASHETVKSRLRYARTHLKNTIGTLS